MKAGAVEFREAKNSTPIYGVGKGISIVDFVLRLFAFIGALGTAIAMGTANETLPFITQFIRSRAEYDDLPSFTFFVAANAVVSMKLLSLFP